MFTPLFAYVHFSQAMNSMLGVPGSEKRARAEKLAPMLAFLKEGVRFALTGIAQEPGRLGFLSALKPFLPHLNAQAHKEKLKVVIARRG